ncbi:phosphatidylinositol glycan, class N [Paragonimus westermani]|uniref:GPI ethanolamine phosphate transferase 1 n=1 Tax=Paragonimus westermani TaxID=34504 RepID=A0A5J4NAE2_9TREM|nr:phosphatidylinositol glycan, class N [Paragonimus westermani]
MSSPGELSDLAKHNLTEIDRWTVDQFVSCLHDNTTGFFAPHRVTDVDMETFRRGHIAFLHMDAADLVGHAFKPNSDEYTQMLRTVDSLVSEVVHEVTRLSSGLDVKVAFILSADHGMTEWGSHGAGSLHETVTPLVAWGAGLVGPELLPSSDALVGFDQYGLPLHNHGRRRRELQQADLCPLMASLLGIPIPVNSVGRVPLDFLDVNSSVKAQLVRANCMQLLSQLQLKLLEKRSSHFRAFFREFDKLTESNIEERLRSAELLTSNGLHDQAIESYEQLANLTLTALAYYHKYDRPFLGLCIGASFFLWSLVIWCNLASPADTKYVSNQYRHWFDQCFQLTTFVLLAFILLVLGFSYLWPISHTAFQLLPLVLSLYLVRSSSYKARLYNTFVLLFRKTKEIDHTTDYHILESNRSGNSPVTFASLISVASLLLLELLIWGFHYRPLLFVACVILAIWPALDRSFGSDRKVSRIEINCLSNHIIVFLGSLTRYVVRLLTMPDVVSS